ncbi:hypothetical protein BJX63DRAFT_31785 [Aspergillus granulosus]|uniref:Rhodopsin domain-containing protein n=1 Tax=Aspergillus granulosus TaxID=176169 RepID=A0ABR4HWX8_9EURO
MAEQVLEICDETRQSLLLSVSILFIILSTIATALRYISRRIGNLGWHREDVLILLGWLLLLAFIGANIDLKYGGIGLHDACVTQAQQHMYSIFVLSNSYIYFLVVVPPRLAVLSLYISIFDIRRWTNMLCHAVGTVIVINMLTGLVVCSVVCRPSRVLWDHTVQCSQCLNLKIITLSTRIVNVIIDFIMLVLPIRHVLGLQMKMALKFGVLVTFALGNIGFIAAIVSLTRINNASVRPDPTWTGATIRMWATVEAGMYLLAACLVSYVPLIKWVWFRLRIAYPGGYESWLEDQQGSRHEGPSREELMPWA